MGSRIVRQGSPNAVPTGSRHAVATPRRAAAGIATSAVAALALAACGGDAAGGGRTPQAVDTTLAAQPVAQYETTRVPAVADTWVSAAQSGRNFGRRNFMTVRGSRESGLLRFVVPAVPGWRVTSAKLELNAGRVSGRGVSVYTTGGRWSETGVTWRTAPAGGVRLATSGAYRHGTWVSWDVAAAVPPAGGPVNLRIENPSNTWMGFLAREDGADVAPRLVLTRTADGGPVPTSPPTPTGPAWTSPVASPAPTATTRRPTSPARPPASSEPTNPTGPAAGGSGSIPVAAPGWRQVYQDHFDGTALGAGWGKYAGAIPSMPGGNWNRSQVEVADGKLKLHTAKLGGAWTSGGVMNNVGAQTTYGKYLIRFRMDKANGVKYALLLWPDSGRWPMDGEIDFAEDGGGTRSTTAGTVHWGTASAHEQAQRHGKADFSTWHTVGVEWTPGKVVFTLDGEAYGSISTSQVPSKPMNLALQTEAGSCNQWMTCTDASTPARTTLEVDWVAVYERS